MKNNVQTIVNRMTMMNKSQKQKMTREEIEANARRKIAQNWSKISKGIKYRKATVRVGCGRVTSHLKNELFDGVLINLQDRNNQKPYGVQKRILRRIVEKRQAQQTHHNIGRTENRFSSHIRQYCASMSMKELRRYQMCA